MAEDCILFPGAGLNQDDSPLSIILGEGGQSDFANGGYRYALNLRVNNTSIGNAGAGENIPSTLAVNNYYVWSGSGWTSGNPQSGTNTAINKYEDRSAGVVYWAVYNSNGHHAILYFVKASRAIYELLQWDGLNFSLSNFVSMTKINKYLLLTDGNPADNSGNPPRCIDVTSIYTLKATLGASFSEYHISLAKWAPIQPPFITMGGSATTGFLDRGIFQFAYRYIFSGGFRSTWSPPSQFVTNELLVTVNPTTTNPTPLKGTPVNFVVNAPGYIYDYANPSNNGFTNADARFYQFVTYIEFAYRESSFQPWKLFSRTPISSGSHPSSVTFTNSGPISTVPDADIGQYFDSVPLLSRCIEAIDNRPMLGNNLDDLSPSLDFNVTDIAVYTENSSDDNWYSGAVGGNVIYGLQTTRFPIQRMSFKEGGIYKLGILWQHYSGRTGLVQSTDAWTYTIPETANAGELTVEPYHALGFKLAGTIPPWAVGYQIVRSNCLNIDFFVKGLVNDFKFLKIDLSGGGSDSSISTSSDIRTAISDYYNSFNSGSGATYSLITRILTAVRKNQTVVTSNLATLIYMDIRNWYLDTIPYGGAAANGYAAPNQTNNLIYNWQPGDRVKFWASTAANYGGSPYVLYDQEIIEFTGTGIIVSVPDNLLYMGTRAQVGAANDNPRLFYIEVYRPKQFDKNTPIIFYEMGEWYPVNFTFSGAFAGRSFSKSDFTWGGKAAVTKSTLNGYDIYSKFPVIAGDVWMVTKNFFWDYGGTNTNCQFGYLLPSFHPTIDTYSIFPQMTQDKYRAADTWEQNIGKPLAGYEYLPTQFEKSTQIRFGGKFLEDSIFVGINNFQDDNQKIYPSEYGKIRAMVNTSNTQVKDVGQILMVICEEETMDVYVNRATLQQLGGQTQVTLSDQVLGSYNTLLGSYGTINPESVSKRNSRVLFWNNKRGMWIRRSIDGLTPISNNKMQNWFKDLSILMQPNPASFDNSNFYSALPPWLNQSAFTSGVNFAWTFLNTVTADGTLSSNRDTSILYQSKGYKKDSYQIKIQGTNSSTGANASQVGLVVVGSNDATSWTNLYSSGSVLAVGALNLTINFTTAQDWQYLGFYFLIGPPGNIIIISLNSATLASTSQSTALSVFDAYYEEWVTFLNHPSLPGTYKGYSSYKSASFDEEVKRWNTIYDYAPDVFAALENELYSIIGTVVHIHYAGTDFGSIYGVKKDCMWQPIANSAMRTTKVWKAINEQSTDKWSIESIDGDYRSNSVARQNSKILLTDLVKLEDVYWADIKRDLNTINAANSDQAIVSGDPMRSKALTLMLKLDSSVTWYSFINWLVVTFDVSEKTVKK